ncbi:MAG: hypothetical protein H7X89_12685, partial [Rhizobiales bacterium]|nr:hypothetical protein [Hyphomicrobiales bacterium]
MKNNPIVIFAGLAAAAVVAVAGVTKNQWMPPNPEITSSETGSTGEQATVQKPVVEETAPEQKLASTEKNSAVEQPADTASQEIESTTEQQTPAAVETETAVAPSFDTVRIEKTGEALIAGRAAPGSEVTVMLDGKAIGKTTANADGAFVLTPESALPTGSGALTVESTNAGGTVTLKSEQSVAVIVPAEPKKETLVAVVSADEPTKILQKAEPAAAEESSATTEVAAKLPLSLDAVDYDESGNIVFSGSGQPGSTVRLYVDNAVAGEAKAGDDGRWSFAGSSPIPAGKHTLRVDGVDMAGTVMSRVELPFFREEASKVASATPEQTEETAPTTTTGTATEQAVASTAATTETTTAATTTEQTASTSAAVTSTTTSDTTAQESTSAAAPHAPATNATASDTTTEQTIAATTSTATEIAKPGDGRIVIQPGNNLWRISRVIYGSGTKYT